MRPDTAAQLRAVAKIADKYISRNGDLNSDCYVKDLERAVRVVKAALPLSPSKQYVHAEFQIIMDILKRDHGIGS